MLGHGLGARGVCAGQQDGELVAAQAGQDVVGLQSFAAQALGHGAQQPVAEAVAQHVVDMLEAVHVQQHDGAGRAVFLGAQDGLAQVVAELLAVGQVGQRILVGQAADLAFAGLDGLAHGLEGLGQIADFVL